MDTESPDVRVPDGFGSAPTTTLFESAAALGYWTGIVTDSYVWDATPAAFFAHVGVRGDENVGEILRQMAGSRLELFAGELEDAGEGAVPGAPRRSRCCRSGSGSSAPARRASMT